MVRKFSVGFVGKSAFILLLLTEGALLLPLMAQDSSPTANELRRRVSEFYSLMRVKRAKDAESLVTADTLDDFRQMPNGEFAGMQISSVEISPDGNSATVTVDLLIATPTLPFPFKLPRKTEWRNGSETGWQIVIPSQTYDLSSTENSAGMVTDYDLKFSQTMVDLTPIIQGERKLAKFPFTNASDHPVTIAEVLSDCKCITLKSEKRSYKAGETGEIVVEFDSSDFQYKYSQTIAVVTEPGAQRINLLLTASIDPKN